METTKKKNQTKVGDGPTITSQGGDWTKAETKACSIEQEHMETKYMTWHGNYYFLGNSWQASIQLWNESKETVLYWCSCKMALKRSPVGVAQQLLSRLQQCPVAFQWLAVDAYGLSRGNLVLVDVAMFWHSDYLVFS